MFCWMNLIIARFPAAAKEEAQDGSLISRR
jgi:hypothetical protein